MYVENPHRHLLPTLHAWLAQYPHPKALRQAAQAVPDLSALLPEALATQTVRVSVGTSRGRERQATITFRTLARHTDAARLHREIGQLAHDAHAKVWRSPDGTYSLV